MKYLLLSSILFIQANMNATQQNSKSATDPDAPSILEHHEDFYLPNREKNLEDNMIYFGKDSSGKPCYKKISEHAKDNPHFGAIKLVSYDSGIWLLFDETFENIGTYSNTEQVARFKLTMSYVTDWRAGGVWCPQLNTMIGRSKDTTICDRFVEYQKKRKDLEN